MDPNLTVSNPGAPVYFGAPATNHSSTVSVGDWVLTTIITAIPLVGLIMLFVWAFGGGTPPSKANWAKANLVFLAVFMVLGFLFASSLIALLSRASNR